MTRKIGICVGQNQYDPASQVTPLKGCINDALLIGQMLRTAGYEVVQIHDSHATQRGILTALENAVASLRDGDHLVFWNSSHGYQIQDASPNGDEFDFTDEAICCFDNNLQEPLSDDKFQRILGRANPKATIFFGSDSCHSGTVTRELMRLSAGLPSEDEQTGRPRDVDSHPLRSPLQLAREIVRRDPTTRWFGMPADKTVSHTEEDVRWQDTSADSGPGTLGLNNEPTGNDWQARLFIPMRSDILFDLGRSVLALEDYVAGIHLDNRTGPTHSIRRLGRLSRHIQESQMNHLLLSGCRPEEVSWDAPFPQGRHGAMTYHFAVAVMEAWKQHREITYRQAHHAATNRLKQRFGQSPQLEGPDTLKDAPVFGYVPARAMQSSKTYSIRTTATSSTEDDGAAFEHDVNGTNPSIWRSGMESTTSTVPADGTLVRSTNGALYVVIDSELCLIDDAEARDGAIPALELPQHDVDALPQGPTVRGVIEAAEENEVRSNMPRRYMATHAWLSQDAGRIDASTRTWTRQPWIGFTGGVIILFAGANGETIGSTELRQYGVDGFRIPFKVSDRTVQWAEGVDPGLAQRVATLRIVHTHAPKERLLAILDQVLQAATLVDQAVRLMQNPRWKL